MAKASDMAAVASAGRTSSSHSISVEQIDNGWLIRQSSCGPGGEYECSETFSPTRPKLVPPQAQAGRALPQGSALGKAVRFLKGD